MRLAKNFLAGVVGSVVATLIGLAVVPVYLRLLGVDGYGLIGFFFALQAFLQVFDLVLAMSIGRSIAEYRGAGKAEGPVQLVATLVTLAWWIAAILTLVLALLAPLFVGHWQQAADGTRAAAPLAWMALALGLRWPAGVYQSVLIGSERMDQSAIVTTGMTALSHLGAVATMLTFGATWDVYFKWQVVASVIHVLWMRSRAWGCLPGARTARASLASLRQTRSLSPVLVAIGAIGLLLTQTDKLVLSQLLPLASYGEYTLASVVAGVFYAIVTPVFSVLYPRFSFLAARQDEHALRELYRNASFMLACLFLPLALALVVGGRGVVAVWTSSDSVAATTAPLVALLGLGSALHGLMYVPWALMLSRGAERVALQISVGLLALLWPLLFGLTWRYGPTGSAAAWPILHLIYVTVGGAVAHKAILPAVARDWLVHDIGLPAGLSFLVGAAVIAAGLESADRWQSLAIGAAACLGTWAMLWLLSGRLRALLRNTLHRSAAN